MFEIKDTNSQSCKQSQVVKMHLFQGQIKSLGLHSQILFGEANIMTGKICGSVRFCVS